MFALTCVTAAYNWAVNEHPHGRSDMPYMKLRNKPFPWECSDCELFNTACWDECKNGKKAESSHGH